MNMHMTYNVLEFSDEVLVTFVILSKTDKNQQLVKLLNISTKLCKTFDKFRL